MRDIGPTFVVDDDARRARRGRLDLQRLGRATLGDMGATTARSRASSPRRPAPSIVSSLLVNEGGAIHVDGEGTRAAHRDRAARPGRNPYADKQRVEGELARTIGATKVIWLPRGLTRDYETSGTRGHVDMVATFPRPAACCCTGRTTPRTPTTPSCARLRGVLEQATDAAGRTSRDHRAARPGDAARRGRLRRLELRRTTSSSTAA